MDYARKRVGVSDRRAQKTVGARQLVRQDGGSGDPFYGANRCNLPRLAHQLASAYKKLLIRSDWCGKLYAPEDLSQLGSNPVVPT